MQFGINLMLWTDRLHDGILPVLEMLWQQGWDGVEVPVLDLNVDYATWGKHLKDFNLRRTASTARMKAENPISPDAKIRAAAVEATKRTFGLLQSRRRGIARRTHSRRAGRVYRQGANRRRMEMGCRQRSANGGVCRPSGRDAGR